MRRDKLIQERIHDPYFVRDKYGEPSVCPKCGVVYRGGVFEWPLAAPQDAQKMMCPACRRIKDNYAGGEIVLEGAFLSEHSDEIVNTVRNTEKSEKAQRPLERIMGIVVAGNRVEVKTTYEHLARRIGEAVHGAFKGELRFQYSDDEKFIRVYWRRD